MLVIAGTIEIDPAKQDEARAAALEMMRATRKEPGCVDYVFSAELAQPGVFRIFEQWESQAALEAHFRAPHMAEFQSKLGGLDVKKVQVQKYEIASIGPVR
jgi:quinol monooxygenase YgiN